MKASSYLLAPLHAAALATGASSFRDNPILGSPALNRRGLHVARVRLAERIADARRRRMTRLAGPEHRDAFAENGFVVVENALPDEVFARLRAEVVENRFPAREMKQGATVTRFITVSPATLRGLPALRGFVTGPLFQGLMRYVAAADHDPLFNIHTVLTQAPGGRVDPQTRFHSDTFHATAKGWLFLNDVETEDGPFTYVPGSHRMTPARLEWEREQSIDAAQNPNGHHALGSFRTTRDEIRAMGYPDPVAFPVRANTFVVADTHGFHARGPAKRAAARLAIYGSLRANPFAPFGSLDLLDLPGLRGRKAQLTDLTRAIGARLTGRPEGQPLVGALRPTDPPVR